MNRTTPKDNLPPVKATAFCERQSNCFGCKKQCASYGFFQEWKRKIGRFRMN